MKIMNDDKLYKLYNIEPLDKDNLVRLRELHNSNWNVAKIINLKLSARQIDILLFRNKDVYFEYRYIKDLRNSLMRDSLSIDPRLMENIWKVAIVKNTEYIGKKCTRLVWVCKEDILDKPVFIKKGTL